ncbi:MAG TPA: SusC/RagA family TonB-linked outer membrane protein, partial [Paludibacter sp.]|nr:SusC/RagA family TonB-linked outer membrane protein [Paludibacter sp.]
MEKIVSNHSILPLIQPTRPSVLSRFFIVFCLLFISIYISAQDVKLTLNIKHKSLTDVLGVIESKTGYSYLVRSNDVNLNEVVSIRVINKTLSEVLAQLFENSEVNFEIRGHNISIFKPQTIAEAIITEKQIPTINGKILDVDGEPIIGATVLVKGTRFGTVSDMDGSFNLQVPGESVLIVSHIGYLPVELKLDHQNNIPIKLIESSTSLNEVVVVAFGIQSKQNMTSSVTQVNAKIIEDKPTNNIASALQGQVAGVNITQSSGQPGQTASIRIRGVGSLQSGTNPLVIVDGVPSSLSMVSNSDVESVSILKDAAACSIYGARAANGVILVTTKRGKLGKLSLNYSGYAGYQQPTELFQEANAYNYANAYNTALMLDGLTASTANTPANVNLNENLKVFSQQKLDDWKSGKVPSTDWRAAMFDQSGFTQSHAVNISGGINHEQIALRNSLGFNYLQQKGNVVHTDYTRYGIRENGEIKWKKFTAGIMVGITYAKTNEPTSVAVGDLWQIINAVNRQRPVDLIKTPDGEWNITSTNDTRNPIRQVNEGGKRTFDNYNILTNINLSYEIAQGLSVNYTNGVNLLENTTDAFKNKLAWSNGTVTGPNSSFKSAYRDIHYLQQMLLKYKKNAGNYNFEALLGAQNEYHTYKYLDAYRQDFITNNATSLQLGSLEGSTNSSANYEWALIGLFGRLNFDFNKKYLFELNFREDFSSRLSVGNKSDFFPAFSAGWMLSEEPFFQSLKPVLSEFKVRASFG